MKQYYITYKENSNINYCFLLSLYLIAERDNKQRLYNTISFKTQKELSQRIQQHCNYNISYSTINRILKNTEYKEYFTVNGNTIVLNNNFVGAGAQSRFIILNDKEVHFLLQQNDNLLVKYYLYIKYYCGYTKNKQIDTTANQVLEVLGYSTKSGNTKNKLSQYNTLLLANEFIQIQRIKDEHGYKRNIYSMNI